MNSLLSLQKITLTLPGKEAPILDDVSLDISLGDFVILLGSNGSGKSSLIRVINGLCIPTSGMMTFFGEDLAAQSLNQRAESIVTLTQDLNLSTFSQLTVLENCLIAIHRKRKVSFSISVKKEREQIGKYLAFYSNKLAGLLDESVSSLSGGERQTLAFAMSLYETPSLLLLDEHTSALDPAMAVKLMQLTAIITKQRAIPTVMTTHDLDDALRYGNRLVVMRHGKLLYDFKEQEKKDLTYDDLLTFYDASVDGGSAVKLSRRLISR